ncbi:Flp family type IVb pilin [Blastococcus haudaquaticus]|uniref:Pilus assembly protein Flp/PilA n=1 Tax=Blastococcus haudaquaticus TaxID=1938745 RepID=A0A286H5H5_9ACTN|nr:Flp family type IVb pilin [Blastococcus haudaquaticus]SOE02942.1 pilus assembly protein Flp/PilA [Blastococcus haudaquaticus]
MLNLFTALQTLAFTVSDRIKSEEKGASAVEYAILVGIIAAVVVAGVTLFGQEITALFTDVVPDAPAGT